MKSCNPKLPKQAIKPLSLAARRVRCRICFLHREAVCTGTKGSSSDLIPAVAGNPFGISHSTMTVRSDARARIRNLGQSPFLDPIVGSSNATYPTEGDDEAGPSRSATPPAHTRHSHQGKLFIPKHNTLTVPIYRLTDYRRAISSII